MAFITEENIRKANEIREQITMLEESLDAILEPLAEEAVNTIEDPDELSKLVNRLPQSFYRSELRVYCMALRRLHNDSAST